MGKPTPIHGIRHARILQTRRPTHRASARFPPPTLPTVSFITPSDADNTMDTVASPRWAQDNNSLLIVHTESSRDDRGWRGDSGPSVEHSTGERIHALATTENLYGLTPFGETAGAPVLDFTSATPLTAASSFVAASSGSLIPPAARSRMVWRLDRKTLSRRRVPAARRPTLAAVRLRRPSCSRCQLLA
jgi:hypothetical protein